MVPIEIIMLFELACLAAFFEWTSYDDAISSGKPSVKFFLQLSLFMIGVYYPSYRNFSTLIDKDNQGFPILSFVLTLIFMLIIEGSYLAVLKKKNNSKND
jgi:hypothetical protein